jgi:hypothetical protein
VMIHHKLDQDYISSYIHIYVHIRRMYTVLANPSDKVF